jgi:hypothetical protein
MVVDIPARSYCSARGFAESRKSSIMRELPQGRIPPLGVATVLAAMRGSMCAGSSSGGAR